jgi:hypothetical protein
MTEEQGSKSTKTAFLIDDNEWAKPMAGIAMTGMIIITALLLSGLSLIGNYLQPAMAQQQNVTGGGGGGENATTTTGAAGGNQSETRFHIEEAITALQNNDTQSALTHLDLALNTLGGTGGTAGNVTTGTTIAGTDNADESSSSTDANRRETDTEEDEGASECGGVTVGGTSAADDYGCPPDPDY